MLRGFDVSHWQGSVDWAKLKADHGISFGFVKATEGVNWVDDQFPANWGKLALAGLVRGAYHFGHPDTNAVDQADHLVDYVGLPVGFDKLICDIEHGDGLTQADVNGWAKAFSLRILARTGRLPLVYTGRAYMENHTADDWNKVFTGWWYPRYPTSLAVSTWPSTFNPVLPSPNSWGGLPDIWQFSSNFTTSQGQLDANVFDGTLTDLRALGTGVTAQENWEYLIVDPASGSSVQAQARLLDMQKKIASVYTRIQAAQADLDQLQLDVTAGRADLAATEGRLKDLLLAVDNHLSNVNLDIQALVARAADDVKAAMPSADAIVANILAGLRTPSISIRWD